MKAFICPCCGAPEFQDENGYKVCQYCGGRFLPNALVQNTPRTQPPVSAGIVINDDVQRLLMKCKTDPKNARKYANLILDIDPNNREAYKYL